MRQPAASRLSSTQNWRGRPLISRQTVVNLIGTTQTKAGLEVRSVLDENSYETGIKVTDLEMEKIRIKREGFHGEWNYEILPKTNLMCSGN